MALLNAFFRCFDLALLPKTNTNISISGASNLLQDLEATQMDYLSLNNNLMSCLPKAEEIGEHLREF